MKSREAPAFPFGLLRTIGSWLSTPVPVLRVEILRICTPLSILGFMSSRIVHADEWLGTSGFRIPDLRHGAKQPLWIPALPDGMAWAVAAILVVSGLALAAGFRTRKAALVFAFVTAFVALSDRLAAFSVSKLAPMVALALALSPAGARFGVDAFLARRSGGAGAPVTHVRSASIRFVQLLLPAIYCASGIAKMRGGWVSEPHILWTHLHGTLQTSVTVALANLLPAPAWTVLQVLTLAFEVLAPLWFGVRRTRSFGLVQGLGMHLMIGLMFGPVRYFAMLMSSLLLAAYTPDGLLERLARGTNEPIMGRLRLRGIRGTTDTEAATAMRSS